MVAWSLEVEQWIDNNLLSVSGSNLLEGNCVDSLNKKEAIYVGWALKVCVISMDKLRGYLCLEK